MIPTVSSQSEGMEVGRPRGGGRRLPERRAAGARFAIALGTLALGLAGAAHAAGILLPLPDIAPSRLAASAGGGSLAAGAERRVRIVRHELVAAREAVENAGAGRVLLNVGEGVNLDVVVERTAPTRWGYSLSGRVAGSSVGFVTLVVHEEAVAGSIWTPAGVYELGYLGGGVHGLREVANAPVDCAGGLRTELPAADTNRQDSGSDGSVVVDILVAYTPAAEENAGGEPQVLSRIDYLVAFANDAFERSGALVALNLVGAEPVGYSEVDRWTDLHRLIDPDDGHMDGVHDVRDALGADLVYLLFGGGGGRGQVLGPFSVGSGLGTTFAHEVGHNMGLLHDRYEAGPETFAHGLVAAEAMICEGTIMAYPNQCRDRGRRLDVVPFYSSPWRYSMHTGRSLGMSRYSNGRGVRGPADAVLAINRNRHAVASFRSTEVR